MNLTPNEVLIIALVAVVVLGPKRLPAAFRKAGQLLAQAREWVGTVQAEVEDAIAVNQPPDDGDGAESGEGAAAGEVADGPDAGGAAPTGAAHEDDGDAGVGGTDDAPVVAPPQQPAGDGDDAETTAADDAPPTDEPSAPRPTDGDTG